MSNFSAMALTLRRFIRGRKRFAWDHWNAANVKVLAYELARQRCESFQAPALQPAPPRTDGLGSLVCRSQDWEAAWLPYWAGRIGMPPVLHRKLWEFAYIAQVLSDAGMLQPGKKGLGFGCGKEPLASLFVHEGCDVLATDLAADDARARAWSTNEQHAASCAGLWVPELCSKEAADERLRFRPLDMNAIPPDLNGKFDFCWSSCALEHLGSIENGLAFMAAAARCLRPGGVAVHTTELNLDFGAPLEQGPTVLFEQHHFEQLAKRLRQEGVGFHALRERDGDPFLDGYVDVPPYPEPSDVGSTLSMLHLRLLIGTHRSTSIGVAMTKPAVGAA